MTIRTVKTDEFTIKSGHLDVGDSHNVWYEQWGNPKAKIPTLLFHGGPGGGYKAKHKYGFNPNKHQVICFDQRGSGNSLPYGETDNNTTADLISDALKILKLLNISRVHVTGGSWGSALALVFAIEQPSKTESVLVNGVFTGSQSEIDWVDKGLFQQFYPEVWDRFVATVPKQFQDNPAAYHHQIIKEGDRSELSETAKAFRDLEFPLLGFDWEGFGPNIKQDPDPNIDPKVFDPIPYKIWSHYLRNNCFMQPKYILKNADKIKAPLYIVQGRYDMVCPFITAYRLHKAVPHSKLYRTLSSHSHDPETRTAIQAIRDLIY